MPYLRRREQLQTQEEMKAEFQRAMKALEARQASRQSSSPRSEHVGSV